MKNESKKCGKSVAVLSLIAAALLLGSVFIAREGALSVHCNFADIEKYNIPSFELDKKLNDIFHRSLSPAVIVANDQVQDREIVELINDNIDNTKDSPFKSVIGLSSLVPKDQKIKREKLKKILEYEYRTPKSKRDEIRPEINNIKGILAGPEITLDRVPVETVRKFLPRNANDSRSLVLVTPGPSRDVPERINRFADVLRNFDLSSGKKTEPVGEFILLSDILKMINRDAPLILILSLFLIFGVLVLFLRDVKASLLIIITTLASFFVTVLFIVALGLEINIYNILVFPVVLGTGVDSSIHLYIKYVKNKRPPIFSIVRRMSSSLSMAAGTTFLGFGALIFAQHDGLESIGWLAMLGMTITFLMTIFVFPYLVKFSEWMTTESKINSISRCEPSKAVPLSEID